MQTQCPICDELISCDKDDIGKSRRCPVCEIDFVAVMIPTADDEKQKEERRRLVVNSIVPVASTMLLFGACAGAFWQRMSIEREAEVAAERAREERRERDRIQNEEAAALSAARVAEAERRAQMNSGTENRPEPNRIEPKSTNTAVRPDAAESPPQTVANNDSHASKTIIPEKKQDLRGLKLSVSGENDPVRKWAGSKLFVNDDRRLILTRSSAGKVIFRQQENATDTEFNVSEFQQPVMLFPLHRGREGFAAVNADGVIDILAPKGGKEQSFRITDAAIIDCTLILDSEIFFATDDGRAGLFSIRGRRLIEMAFSSPLRCVCVPRNRDGYVTGGTDRQIHWFNSYDHPTTSFLSDIPIEVMAAMRSRSDRDYFVAVGGNGVVEVLSQKAGGIVFRKPIAGSKILDLAFSDGHSLGVVTDEGLLLVFSLQDGQLTDLATIEGVPAGIEFIDSSGRISVWTDEIIEAGSEPFSVTVRQSMDPAILAAATDASVPFPESGDPEIRLMEHQAKRRPLAIESLATDRESRVITVRGHGFSGVEEIMVLRPGETNVRLKASVISDSELTAPWSPRVSGGTPVIQSGDRIAVPVPWHLKRVVLPTNDQGGTSPAKSDSDEDESDVAAVAPDVSGSRFLTGDQELAVVPDSCEFLLMTEGSAITEAVHGKCVIVYQSTAELPDGISDDARLILQAPAGSERKPRGKSIAFTAGEVIACPVRDGIPLP